MSPLDEFATAVGPEGPICCAGGRTQWDVGRAKAADPAPVREVHAPVGVVDVQPAEMTVRVRAGSTVEAVDAALAEHGQTVALPDWPGATVGGVLAVGCSGIRRLGWGPVRDTLLEARYVSSAGALVKAGGPTVKNVSGFDLCRLLVGSLGTLGLLAEVVLRTRPKPERSAWLAGEEADPRSLRRSLFAPSCLLWNGVTTWVLLEGRGADVEAQSAVARAAGLLEVDRGPVLPAHRSSMDPASIDALPEQHERGAFVVEVGVGTLHTPHPIEQARPPASVVTLHRRVKDELDPAGRLNPNCDPLR